MVGPPVFKQWMVEQFAVEQFAVEQFTIEQWMVEPPPRGDRDGFQELELR